MWLGSRAWTAGVARASGQLDDGAGDDCESGQSDTGRIPFAPRLPFRALSTTTKDDRPVA